MFSAAILAATVPTQPSAPPIERWGNNNPQHIDSSNSGNCNSSAFKPVTSTYQKTSNAGQNTRNRPKEPGWFGIPFDGWVAIFTGFLFLATAGLFFFTALLWRATKNLIVEERENSARELRAYVSAEKVDFFISTQFAGGTQFVDGYVFTVVWRNVGKTPAKKLHSVIQPQIYPANEDRFPAFIMNEPDPQTIDLGPNQTAKTANCFISIATLRSIWLRENEVILWARLEYSDALEPNIGRYTERCVRIDFIHDPQVVPPASHPPYVTFSVFGPHNGSS